MTEFPPELIRNFSIIAHIDHGKSTLADRMMELAGVITKSEDNKQVLDKLEVERSRGITVKANTVSLLYRYSDGKTYLLNLVDTPGHVDFSYEVSRSLSACQGALLLVDGSRGVQAQTMANFFLAFEADLQIIPVVNKIDLPTSDFDRVSEEMRSAFDFEKESIIKASAKSGVGVKEIFDSIIEQIPPPKVTSEDPLRMLLFDSWFDEHRGVICLFSLLGGELRKGQRLVSHATKKSYDVYETGVISPGRRPLDALYAGQVGYAILNMRNARDARVGDTFSLEGMDVPSLPGFQPAKAMVYAGIYPYDSEQFLSLSSALEKLSLTDASISYRKESSDALGLGFRCGFLGLLHMDVFRQRLESEYEAEVLVTAPTVPYIFEKIDGTKVTVENPQEMPPSNEIAQILEPMVNATILLPVTALGEILKLCHERRGVQNDMTYLNEDRVVLKYLLPLGEVITDFYNDLKACSAGYASLDYEEAEWQPADVTKLSILLNDEPVDAMSFMVHKAKVEELGKLYCSKLKKTIPRQMFQVKIQAKAGGRIVAAERLQAFRKDVTAKLYGGDVTRKKKLLAKQKEGKKRMKMCGNVAVSQEAFIAVMKR